MNYEEEIKQILEESKEEIKEQTKQALKQKIIDTLNWSLSDEIGDIVKEVIDDELKDEIKNTVLESKQQIINEIKPVFITIGAELAKKLETKITENIQSSWKSDKIIKDLFN